MGLFRKKADPISDRARTLNAEISALEARIKRLNQQVQSGQGPRLRSTVYPSGPGKSPAAAASAASEPIFEDVGKLTESGEPAATPQHFNELGVRKFDLLAVWQRLKKQVAGRPLANPKLINYLAAGSLQGLRPLRYEKRVARNRFFFLAGSVGLLLLGFFLWLFANRR
jgi:cell division septum initiation protein DivIVA